MSSYSYYPGCSLHKSAQEYDQSTRLVAGALGIELKELEDWNCCGASAAHHTSEFLALALSARNLALAEKEKKPIIIPCPACSARLKTAAHELKAEPALVEKLKKDLDISVTEPVEVLSLLEVIAKLPAEKIKEKVKVNLSALKVVPYYGCLLVRPKQIAIDDIENPMLMDNLLEAIGVTVMPWEAKVTCCGSSISVADMDLVTQLSGDIIERAHLAGAQAMVVACPLCHANLDLRQPQIRAKRKNLAGMPIFYFTQLIGLALGFSAEQVGLDKNIVDPTQLIKSCVATS